MIGDNKVAVPTHLFKIIYLEGLTSSDVNYLSQVNRMFEMFIYIYIVCTYIYIHNNNR